MKENNEQGNEILTSINQIKDELVNELLIKELKRQQEVIELIASENIASRAVMQAQGSWLTNKYSEGYPGKRYYGGNEHVDEVENLARERVKELFGAEHANVQPHSGSSANLAAYMAVLKPGDTVLGMNLDNGGHLTHGSSVNFSGKIYNFVPYGVRNDGLVDMEEVERLALEHKPKTILAGYSAYSRILDFEKFLKIARKVSAYFIVDMAHFAGLSATGVYPNPVKYADIVTTTTHKTLRGPRGGVILCKKQDPYTGKSLARKVDSAIFPGSQGGPLDHVIAAKAVAFGEALRPEFKEYQRQVVKNAKVLCEELMKKSFNIVSGGTDNHLMLIDLRNKNISGGEAEKLLDDAGICTNKNMIPKDEKMPQDPSGIRIGTPAVTTRGMKEREMIKIAELIDSVITNRSEENVARIKEEAKKLCEQFRIYS